MMKSIQYWLTSRFIFLPPEFALSLGHFQLLLASMDINLESFPFPATITSLDSMLVGTPVIAWRDSFLSVQYGFSQLTQGIYSTFRKGRYADTGNNEDHLGEEDKMMALLLGYNPEDYLRKAILVANNDGIRCKLSKVIFQQKANIFETLSAVEEWREFLFNINQ